jgi:hypothetical protein
MLTAEIHITKNEVPRTKNQEPRTKNKEQRTKYHLRLIPLLLVGPNLSEWAHQAAAKQNRIVFVPPGVWMFHPAHFFDGPEMLAIAFPVTS